MNELSLFSGAGGGLLGTKLLGWQSVGYVERDPYCQAVLQARIRDGFLDPAPVFGDIRQFLSGGWAERYRGLVDVVTAGFPCQPFSVAGKRAGADDARNLWPETAEVLRVVRPRYALLENVPGLLSSGYFGQVLGDLAALGFDAEWGVLGADDVGAPHRRKRLWILAHASWDGRAEREARRAERKRTRERGESGDAAHTERNELRDEPGRQRGEGGSCAGVVGDDGAPVDVADADSPRLADDSGRAEDEGQRGDGALGGGGWWARDPADDGFESESFVGRVAHGVANRVDRLRALGNGQVSAVVVRAWQELYGRLVA